MLRDVIWRMLYLRRRFGSGARIVLSKIDVSEAFRPVSVLRAGPPVFGYSFREWVVRDRPLQFGWRSSRGGFSYVLAALEHPHRHTSDDDAVVREHRDAACCGKPTESDRPPTPTLPFAYDVPRRRAGGRRCWFSYDLK